MGTVGAQIWELRKGMTEAPHNEHSRYKDLGTHRNDSGSPS